MPRAIGIAEEGFGGQIFMFCELASIIERDGFGLEGSERLGQPRRYRLCVFAIRVADDDEVARFALDRGDKVVFASFKEHEVGLPMVVVCAVLDMFASGVNRGVNRGAIRDFAARFSPLAWPSPWPLAPQALV